ncbi:hypothetical protein TraAM80_00055 [Trypanosoma rangeli]|uniref:Rab-GAP TBC domain-containing protein n=1 Tax=Trypanosoma rangeli TaxID=5698 RepID=A0A3R7N507_TRYRA|nr:uncharacterized protein TraAM80_00055 [Trypanosoma rangeli]RNF12897.1 hypothetical protein TraAM80_00055 [Trypanosoma rangeli]|eukprot:RNF12897.1 hypothetical protein TraAM80_00055 [Trypanosoma rangeli]
MSVVLDVNTIMTALWPSARGKVTRSTGQILEITLVDKGTTRFTHVVFDPTDEATFYASSSEGLVYLFSLRKNAVKLFAALEYPIASMARCGNGANPLFVCATEDLSLVWLDCRTSRILQRVKTPHLHAVHMMHAPVGLGSSWLATISRDALALWDATQMACQVHSHITTADAIHDFLSVHAEANLLLTVENSGVVRTWDTFTLMPINTVKVEMRPRTAAACQKYIALGFSNATVGFLKIPDLSSICCVQLSTAPAATRSLSIINDDLLACELTDGTVVFLLVSNYSVAFAMAASCSGVACRGPASFSVSGPSFGVFLRGNQLTLFYLPIARQYYLRRTKWNGADPNPALPQQLYPFLRQGESTRATGPAEQEQKSIRDTTLPRPAIHLSEQQVSKWVKVDLLRPSTAATAAKEVGSRTCVASSHKFEAPFKGRKAGAEMGANEMKENELSQRPFLDRASRAANMKYLKRLLMSYGMFPEKFRSLIWRFLLQLSERRFTAPQYTQLLSKGTHRSVHSLLRPFPLANKKMRTAMENVLSILAWHVPFFAVIHFLPMIVYPFLQVYGDDIQSTVEVVLVVLSNWGQEFFQYYPQHPVALTALLNQLLRTEDAELHSHLDQCGVMAEEWGWELLKSFDTDILTTAAWLQVMDHVFFNRPIWFFLFHVRWLVSLRAKLMKLYEHQELLAAFSAAQSINVNKVIAEAYGLYGRYPTGDLTEPYRELHSFVDYAYPVAWKINKETITRKLADFQQSLQHEGQEAELCRELQGIREQMTEAEVLEDVFVEKRRAEFAAQLIMANDHLQNEVAREKEKQRARELKNVVRIQAAQKHLQHADRLEALKEELISTRVQVADLAELREKETRHWKLAESLTDHEVRRLEEAARERLVKAKRAIEEAEKKSSPQSGEGESGSIPVVTTPPVVTAARSPLEMAIKTPRTPIVSRGPVQVYRTMQSCATRGVNETHWSEHHQERLTGGQPPTPPALSSFVPVRSPLYDNLFDDAVPGSQSETKWPTNVHAPSQRRRPSSDHDEHSSAGTVLLRSRGSTAYRLPRPPHERLSMTLERGHR